MLRAYTRLMYGAQDFGLVLWLTASLGPSFEACLGLKVLQDLSLHPINWVLVLFKNVMFNPYWVL